MALKPADTKVDSNACYEQNLFSDNSFQKPKQETPQSQDPALFPVGSREWASYQFSVNPQIAYAARLANPSKTDDGLVEVTFASAAYPMVDTSAAERAIEIAVKIAGNDGFAKAIAASGGPKALIDVLAFQSVPLQNFHPTSSNGFFVALQRVVDAAEIPHVPSKETIDNVVDYLKVIARHLTAMQKSAELSGAIASATSAPVPNRIEFVVEKLHSIIRWSRSHPQLDYAPRATALLEAFGSGTDISPALARLTEGEFFALVDSYGSINVPDTKVFLEEIELFVSLRNAPVPPVAAPTPAAAPASAEPSRTQLLIRKLQFVADYLRGRNLPSDFSLGTLDPAQRAAMAGNAERAERIIEALERGGEQVTRLESLLQRLPSGDFNPLTEIAGGRPDPSNWINSIARAEELLTQAASVPAAVAPVAPGELPPQAGEVVAPPRVGPTLPGVGVEITSSHLLVPVSEEAGQLTSALRGMPLSGKLVKPTDIPLNSLQKANQGQLLGYAQRFATQIESDGQLAENLTALIRQRMEPESFRGMILALRGKNLKMIFEILKEFEDLISLAAQMGPSGVLPEPPTRQTELPSEPTRTGIQAPKRPWTDHWGLRWLGRLLGHNVSSPASSAAKAPAVLAAGAQGGVTTGKPATVSVQGAVAVRTPPPTPPAATPTPKPASEPIDLLIQILKQTSEQFKKDPDRIGYFAKVFARKLEEGGDVTKMMLRVLERAKSEPGIFDFSLLHRAQSGDVTAQKDLVIAVQNLERKKGGVPLPNPPRTWWKFWTWFSEAPEVAVQRTAARLAAAAQAASEAKDVAQVAARSIPNVSTLRGEAAVAALTPPPPAPPPPAAPTPPPVAAPAAPALPDHIPTPELRNLIEGLNQNSAFRARLAMNPKIQDLWGQVDAIVKGLRDASGFTRSKKEFINACDFLMDVVSGAVDPAKLSDRALTIHLGNLEREVRGAYQPLGDATTRTSASLEDPPAAPEPAPAPETAPAEPAKPTTVKMSPEERLAAASPDGETPGTPLEKPRGRVVRLLHRWREGSGTTSAGKFTVRDGGVLAQTEGGRVHVVPANEVPDSLAQSGNPPTPVTSTEVPASVPTAAAISSALPGTFAAEIEGIDAAGTAIGAAAVNDINIGLSTSGKIGFGINVITGPLSLWYLLGEHGQKDQERLSNRHEINEAGTLQYLSGKATYYTSIAGAAVGTGSAIAGGTLLLAKVGVIGSPFLIAGAAYVLPYLAFAGLVVMAIGTPAYLVYDKSTEDDNTKLMLDDIRKGINGDEKAIEHLNRVAQEADDSTFKKFLQIELLENQQNRWMLDRTNPKVAAFWTNPKLKTFYDEAIDTLLGKQENAGITALANPLKGMTDSLHRNLSYVGGDELAMALTMAQFSGDARHLERAKQVYEGRFSDRVSRWWSDDKAEYTKWQTGLKLASFEELTQKGASLPPFSRDPIIKEFCETEVEYSEKKGEVCDEINEKAPEACYLDPKDTNKTYSNISKQWSTMAEEHGMARSRDQVTINLMEKRALVAACHAIKNEPEKADTFAQFGKAAYLQNKDNVALTLYQRAVQLDPTNPEFYEKMGDVYKALTYEANDNAKKELRFKAIDSYKKAIDQLKTPEEKANSNLNREIATLYQKLSEQDLKEKNYPAAKEKIDQAVVYFRHENALENLYLYAERDLATALKQQLATRKSAEEKIEKPAEQKTWEEIASLYERNFNREKGFFTKNKEDDSFSLNFDAAEAFYKAGNDEKAISLYEQSLRYAGYLPRAEREERKGIAFLGLARAHHRLASKAEKHSTEQIAHYQAAIQNYASANRALQAAEPKTYLNDVKRGSAVENMMDCELGLSESPNYNHLIQLGEEAKRSFEGALAKVTDDPTKSAKIQRDIDRVNKRLDDFRSRVPATPPPQRSEPKKGHLKSIDERPI